MQKHFHWDFIGFIEKTETGNILWPTKISVQGYDSEDVALQAAKNLLTRPNYFLERVYECANCGFQDRILKELRSLGSHGGSGNE